MPAGMALGADRQTAIGRGAYRTCCPVADSASATAGSTLRSINWPFNPSAYGVEEAHVPIICQTSRTQRPRRLQHPPRQVDFWQALKVFFLVLVFVFLFASAIVAISV